MGKTYPYQQPPQVLEKHPHVRGEDGSPQDDIVGVLETPPRAWGRLFIFGHTGSILRNTPTCVGKTTPWAAIPIYPSETPPRAWGRLRLVGRRMADDRNTPTCVGKTAYQRPMLLLNGETPPRAWGRRYRFQRVRAGYGNTPTCVGKTLENFRVYGRVRKHPHVRGEDAIVQDKNSQLLETPPRAWGRLAIIVCRAQIHRNTPTCVGKTSPAGS